MATLILTAVGTAIAGPIGGAIGSVLGSQIDRAVIGGGRQEGPRLRELAITTSSYGTPIPRHFGTMRAPGSIIWATDMQEARQSSGGGKGRPSVTSYSYSASFAVALASRPIRGIGRIWADGNLLRGTAGDLKTGGTLRVHPGYGDQMPDPLIASDRGPDCPAFRDLAYCVFEDLHLADFGNRIPALTFEIIADEGGVDLVDLVAPSPARIAANRALPGLRGFSDGGGPLSTTLAALSEIYPMHCTGFPQGLSLKESGEPIVPATGFHDPLVDGEGDAFGRASGTRRTRSADRRPIPTGIRYYDTGRDYQAGLQRADGRARAGGDLTVEFPGALAAQDARNLANQAADRAGWARDTVWWRTSIIDTAIGPGAVVTLPDRQGTWRIASWEWRDTGVELELLRLPHAGARISPADAGTSLPAEDRVTAPSIVAAFGLPWDGIGQATGAPLFVAVSAASPGWSGAALHAVSATGDLVEIGLAGSARAVIGTTLTPLAGSPATLLEFGASIDVQLVAEDLALDAASPEQLATGTNRALVGGEILQFASALPLGQGRWRLQGLLRGRGGTEGAAIAGHGIGARFVLIDRGITLIDPAPTPMPAAVAAIGLGDPAPATGPIINPDIARAPLCPVHGHMQLLPAGGIALRWCRRSRGSWAWQDHVDAPLNEEAESYLVGIGNVDAPSIAWTATSASLEIAAAQWANVRETLSGQPLWVRQIGTHAASPPLLLGLVQPL